MLLLEDGRSHRSVGPAYADPVAAAFLSAGPARYAVLEVEAGRLLGCEMIALAMTTAAARAVSRPARLGMRCTGRCHSAATSHARG